MTVWFDLSIFCPVGNSSHLIALAADQCRLLRGLGIRIGSQDLKIAAIAIVNDALLLSANLHDFRQVPELMVESWLD